MQIRELRDEEASVAFTLHNRMNHADRTPDQWRWEYRGLMPEKNVFCVIEENGEILGTQAMMPCYLRIGDQAVLTGKSENSLLDPRLRGGTHFTDLYEFCVQKCKEKGMAIIWGFTPAVKVWRDKLGFQVYEDSLFYSRFVLTLGKQLKGIRRSNSKASDMIKVYLGTIGHYVFSRYKSAIFKMHMKKDIKITQGFKAAKDGLSLSERLREEYHDMVQIQKDADFLGWRVYGNPNLIYRTICAYEGDDLRGYIHYSRKGDNASIADLTYDDPSIAEVLLSSSMAEWRKDKVASISFFGNMENPYTKKKFDLLERMGFMTRKNDMSFVVRFLRDDMVKISDMRRWCFDFLWLEGYNS